MIKLATRLIVISDLHLGGNPPYMMSHADRLAQFLSGLSACAGADESLELVIAGDFVDFLAIAPHASWTPNPREACQKLTTTMEEESFRCVFDAMSKLVDQGGRITVIMGNHDVEFTLPQVQETFLRRLGATPHEVQFIDDGRAYRIGRALIEHGNRYDGANMNDWEGLRAIASALSRGETPNVTLKISAGSTIVEKVVNPIKQRYPFIDLLQPCGELLAFLLLSFEPALQWDIGKLARILHGQRLQNTNRRGLQPGETKYVAYSHFEERDEELAQAFGPIYEQMRAPKDEVSKVTDWIGLFSTAESLAEILNRGDPIPKERLEQIRIAMRRLLLDDTSSHWDGDAEQYGRAAERIRKESQGDVEVVIMGHTHLARRFGPKDRASYINTGTWADVIQVPHRLLEPGTDRELTEFLRSLKEDTVRDFIPTYADLRISTDGSVQEARLRSAAEVQHV